MACSDNIIVAADDDGYVFGFDRRRADRLWGTRIHGHGSVSLEGDWKGRRMLTAGDDQVVRITHFDI